MHIHMCECGCTHVVACRCRSGQFQVSVLASHLMWARLSLCCFTAAYAKLPGPQAPRNLPFSTAHVPVGMPGV